MGWTSSPSSLRRALRLKLILSFTSTEVYVHLLGKPSPLILGSIWENHIISSILPWTKKNLNLLQFQSYQIDHPQHLPDRLWVPGKYKVYQFVDFCCLFVSPPAKLLNQSKAVKIEKEDLCLNFLGEWKLTERWPHGPLWVPRVYLQALWSSFHQLTCFEREIHTSINLFKDFLFILKPRFFWITTLKRLRFHFDSSPINSTCWFGFVLCANHPWGSLQNLHLVGRLVISFIN